MSNDEAIAMVEQDDCIWTEGKVDVLQKDFTSEGIAWPKRERERRRRREVSEHS
jgi:hypothetical protein